MLSGRVSERASEGLRREYVFLTLDNITRLGEEGDFLRRSTTPCTGKRAREEGRAGHSKTECLNEESVLHVSDYFVPFL